MKEQVKELRVKIDGLYQLTKELKPIKKYIHPTTVGGESKLIGCKNSKEIEDAAHSLIYAKAWLGKVLGELGAENPYKSGYKTVSDIEPTADKATGGRDPYSQVIDWDSSNHIIRIDWLRTEIEVIINQVKNLGRTTEMSFTKEFNIARTNCYNHLCEARFALGFELERIKLENK